MQKSFCFELECVGKGIFFVSGRKVFFMLIEMCFYLSSISFSCIFSTNKVHSPGSVTGLINAHYFQSLTLSSLISFSFHNNFFFPSSSPFIRFLLLSFVFSLFSFHLHSFYLPSVSLLAIGVLVFMMIQSLRDEKKP